MSTKFVELRPKYLLNEDWKIFGQIPVREEMIKATLEKIKKLEATMREEEWRSQEEIGKQWIESLGGKEEIGRRWLEAPVEEKEKIAQWIKSTKITVADVAETVKISSTEKYDYLKSELGMNIILPQGSIRELRFKVILKGDGKISEEVVAIDGFPKDVVEEKEIIGGKIKVGITKAFKFVPMIGNTLTEFLEIELNPWEFKLGSLRKVNVDFSGGLTSEPEWYFKKDGIKNDLRVALTIRKLRDIRNTEAIVTAGWEYADPGISNLFKRLLGVKNLKSDEKPVKIIY